MGFFSGGKHHSKSNFSNQALNKNCKSGDKYSAISFLRMKLLVSLLVALTGEMYLQQLFVKMTSSLKLLGDIDLNPGPYKNHKISFRSFQSG